MTRTKIAAAVCAGILALTLSACTAGAKPVNFPAGTTMDRLHKARKITVGVKFDQPGLGFRHPATGKLVGFDIRMAEIVAAELGLTPAQITYLETVSKDREQFLQSGRVDILIASYSINAERRRLVGQAGPYYETGQQLLVRKEDSNKINGPDDISEGNVCSATSSTAIKFAREKYKDRFVEYNTYTECVQQLLRGSVRAVLTDGAVLLGYAAQSPKLRVVGKPFSVERWGIGYTRGDLAFCQFLTDTITKAMHNGEWQRAFKETLGSNGAAIPAIPTLDPCQN